MKKWVIKKNQAGTLEVWRYIDTIKEAEKYWYVMYAIERHGEDEILPIAMNSMGGYHSLNYDIEHGNIVNIIESDTEPLIGHDVELTHTFDYGWVSPECKPFVCAYGGHLTLAAKLAFMKYQYEEATPDDYLLQNGWAKVNRDETGKTIWIGDLFKMDDSQIKWLEQNKIEPFKGIAGYVKEG